MESMFEHFVLNGIDYYCLKGKYYCDNMTIRQEISLKEYRNALMEFIINN